MIFKILKGTDIDFEISLEKTEYKPSERVRELLTLKTNKISRIRQLLLFAEGKESTIITESDTTSRHSTTGTYKESNTFYSENLSRLLQNSVNSNILRDGTLEILPQNKEVAIEFTLPSYNSLFSTYTGMHANITYTLKATADIANMLDINKEEHFSVINPNNNRVVLYSGDTTSFGGMIGAISPQLL